MMTDARGSQSRDHAVVLGASMAGLLAARVLAEFFAKVTIVERDVLPDDSSNRKGVPQGRQVHALMRRGSQILGELFPGVLDELVAGGVPVWDDGDLSKIHLVFGGYEVCRSGQLRDPEATTVYSASRPFLEYHVRRRVRALANVTFLDGREVIALTTTPQRSRVTGVRVQRRGTDVEEVLDADLIVDATGRGSRTPALLQGIGYDRPVEDELVVRLAYGSQQLRIPSGMVPEKVMLIGVEPGRSSAMALFGYENDTWLLTTAGLMGCEAPTDFPGMVSFIEPFTPDHVVAALRAAEPVGETVQYRVPSSRWRRYDKMGRFPDGLLVTGDAICSFNPIYGQGMTVAALDALALRESLRRGDRDLAARYFRASAKEIAVAWQMAVGSDLALPEVVGKRSPSVRVTNWYTRLVQAAAETDSVVAESFLRVMHLVDRPTRLLHPSVVARVLAQRTQRDRQRQPELVGA
jgi:2-polyprenyl-6-methoxyphenol hydroxylase-like FAD-dependent oxidoreductase